MLKVCSSSTGGSNLFDKIEDSKDNHTRFVILSSTKNEVISKDDKASILVNLTDGHGVLTKFLQRVS